MDDSLPLHFQTSCSCELINVSSAQHTAESGGCACVHMFLSSYSSPNLLTVLDLIQRLFAISVLTVSLSLFVVASILALLTLLPLFWSLDLCTAPQCSCILQVPAGSTGFYCTLRCYQFFLMKNIPWVEKFGKLHSLSSFQTLPSTQSLRSEISFLDLNPYLGPFVTGQLFSCSISVSTSAKLRRFQDTLHVILCAEEPMS